MTQRDIQFDTIELMLKPTDVAKMLGVSRPIINYWRKEGIFPEPIMLTPKTPRWRVSTINQWIDSKVKKKGKSSQS